MISGTNNLFSPRLTPLLLMFAVMTFEMSTDLYLSSLPEIGNFFRVSEGSVKITLSAYLLGFALLGLFSGPLSDSIGRRPVTLASLALFTGGSLCCWVAPTIKTLIVARFMQGVGAGMAMVVITAIIKDIYDEKECSRILSSMGIVITLSPIIAPIAGGKIANAWGWKSCFFIIALIAVLITIMMSLSLEESLMARDRLDRKSSFSARKLYEIYSRLLRRPEVATFSLISAITLGGLWAWIVEAPFYIINVAGVKSSDYGYYAAIGPAAYIIGMFLNRQMVLYYPVERALAGGLILMICGASVSLLSTIAFPYSLSILYAGVCIYAAGLAPVFANAVTKAILVIPSQRGAASALLTTLEMGFSAICAFLASWLSNGTLVPCTVMMLASAIICVCLFITVSKRNIVPVLVKE
jgi:DHA1 family bicyclomycin/chloramphenicol resistance-like MFS transporter